MATSFQGQTPVALIIFNRPDLTRLALAAIRVVKPPRLFVISDGPRAGHPEDQATIEETRRVIETCVDWPCVIDKNYLETNWGCGRRISSGLDWVFSQVDRAIILEDDCVADPSFFRFCEELLEVYADDPQIMHISGNNFLHPSSIRHESSYYFSIHTHSCGWATWRRAWVYYDHEVKLWPQTKASGGLKALGLSRESIRHFTYAFDSINGELLEAWDYRWTFACWMNGGLAILPAVNLIENVGFEARATHATKQPFWGWPRAQEMSFPLIPPASRVPDREADTFTNNLMFSRGPLNLIWLKMLQLKLALKS